MAILTRENLLIKVNGSGLLVSDATIEEAPKVSARRFVTAPPVWGHEGPREFGITLRGNLNNNWGTFLGYATGTGSFSFMVNEVEYTDCFLQEYEIEGTSHSPIKVSARLVTWDEPSGEFGAGILTGSLGDDPYHASQSTFAQTGISFPDEFSFKIQSERIPRFTVGSTVPVVKLARVEKELVMKGKNITGFLGYAGSSGSAAFSLSNGDSAFAANISGHITDQDLSLDDLLVSSITIKSFLR